MEISTERRWSRFMTLEMLLIPLVAVGGYGFSPEAERLEWTFNGFTIWLVVSLPIFFCTIGRTFVSALAADICWPDCPEEKALREELRTRPALDDAEFYARFFQHSGIPKEVPAGIRQILRDVYWDEVDRLIPSDDLRYFDVDLGIGGALIACERTFRITIDQSEYGKIDYSLDGIIRLVHRRTKGYRAWADDAIC